MKVNLHLRWLRVAAVALLCCTSGCGESSAGENRVTCGNGQEDPGEGCDFGINYNGRRCPDGYSGYLYCTQQCEWSSAGCSSCGDGQVGGDDECDGADLGGATCLSQGTTGGVLACGPSCRFDLTGCTGPLCGNGVREGDEVCDGEDLAGVTCEQLGHQGGAPTCDALCTIDPDSCFDCGNGVCEWTAGETAGGCGTDCPGVCGDGRCEPEAGEGPGACGMDCGVTAISAGSRHGCALLVSGTVLCWGANEAGQLGLPAPSGTSWPTRVAALSPGVASVAAGHAHTCALSPWGTVLCWGANDMGQLGSGPGDATSVPVEVPGLDHVVVLAAGARHTCALNDTGAAFCWGANGSGQLGNGDTLPQAGPVIVSTEATLSSIAPGYGHTCAVTPAGEGLCWGANGSGQLGDGTQISRTTPVSVTGLHDIVGVTTAEQHSCAVLESGRVVCWGSAEMGLLGSAISGVHPTPETVMRSAEAELLGCVAVAAGLDHTCALSVWGAVACWGTNDSGQLGRSGASRCYATEVPGATAVQLTAGTEHTCITGLNATGWCWGANGAGQVGDGTFTDRDSPAAVFQP